MFNAVTPGHLIVLAVVLVLLFGAKKLPDAARSLGKSMRIFKSEVKEMQADGKSDETSAESTSAPTAIRSERVDTAAPAPAPEQATDTRPA